MRKPADHIFQDFAPLTPVLHPWIKEFTQDSLRLQQAVKQYGSPVNIHCLNPFDENIRVFKQTFRKYGLKHKIYFARKANKCLSFATRAWQLGEGVDTASFRELEQCLKGSVPAQALIITAAVKNEQLLSLAIENGVTVVIDNLDECRLMQYVASKLNKQVQVCVRISGFYHQGRKLHSRFGIPVEEAKEFIMTRLGVGNTFDRLVYTGLHFHLNGYSISERGQAILQCITLIDELKKEGITTYSLDIGGGILVNYLQSEQEWTHFHRELKKAVRGERTALTYRNDPLGMVLVDGKLYREPSVYPYFNLIHKQEFLDRVLTCTAAEGTPVFELLRERAIEVRMEPGRSVLDQAGITLARVAFRRRDTAGELLVGLEMNRTQLKSSSADFLLDPIHIPAEMHERSGPVYGYLVGAYCLEQELILKRKVAFRSFPLVGDLLVFPNTAGYMMHFYESEAHLFNFAENVVYDPDTKEITKPFPVFSQLP